jgi:RNA polymerase sigma-70 factor (ECF subfamily)
MNGQAMGSRTVASTVTLAGAGDEAAFAQLVATYHADMARVAFVACGDRELAEDAVQSAWLVAWRKLRSLRDPDRVRPWLLAVTANEARQLLRRRHGPVVEIDVEASGDPRGDPSAGIERLDLRRALAHLSPDDRALLAMHYLVDLGSDELGAAVGTSPSTARTRLSRAVERLRKELRDG